MARVKVPRPNSTVRLKKWGPGRIAQLKLFLGHLEQAIGISLAAQVAQSPKRNFSEFVPKVPIQDITAEVEYKEIRFTLVPPKGLKNLLFYEYVISVNENFARFDLEVSPDPQLIFPNLLDDTTYFMKVRVVTKDGFVGPYSDTISGTTPFSQSFGLFDGTEVQRMITQTFFTELFARDYTAIRGRVYYSIEYEIRTLFEFSATDNINWSDIELHWADEPDGSPNLVVGNYFQVTTYRSHDRVTSGIGQDMVVTTDSFSTELVLPGPFEVIRRGTFNSVFSTLVAGDHIIRLFAKTLPSFHSDTGRNDFVPNDTFTSFLYGGITSIKLKNFNIFEALVSEA